MLLSGRWQPRLEPAAHSKMPIQIPRPKPMKPRDISNILLDKERIFITANVSSSHLPISTIEMCCAFDNDNQYISNTI